MSSSSSSSSGIGCLSLLGLIFVTLKLVAVDPVASWSWWWVLAPFWGPVGILVVVLIFLFGGAWMTILLRDRKSKNIRYKIKIGGRR